MAMRSRFLPLFFVLGACASTPAPAPSSPQAPTAASATAASSGLHPELARIAVTADNVDEFELRLDADGELVKQAVYHDKADAISDAVKAKTLELYPGATITHFETEHYADAGVVHEVEVKTADGQSCEVSATPDGAVRYQECELDLATLPAQITAAVKSAYPEGKLLEAETKKGPTMDVITVEVVSGGVEYYLYLTPDGSIEQVFKRVEAVVEIPTAVP